MSHMLPGQCCSQRQALQPILHAGRAQGECAAPLPPVPAVPQCVPPLQAGMQGDGEGPPAPLCFCLVLSCGIAFRSHALTVLGGLGIF